MPWLGLSRQDAAPPHLPLPLLTFFARPEHSLPSSLPSRVPPCSSIRHLTVACLPACLPLTPADKLGTGFALVRHDVGGNIERLAACAAAASGDAAAAYAGDVFQMVRDDVAAGTSAGSASVTKGLLWLKRWVGKKARACTHIDVRVLGGCHGRCYQKPMPPTALAGMGGRTVPWEAPAVLLRVLLLQLL